MPFQAERRNIAQLRQNRYRPALSRLHSLERGMAEMKVVNHRTTMHRVIYICRTARD
jgi:hypothetical protein